MKKLIFTFLLILTTIAVVFSQVPNAFNYQAVVRNSSGEIVANKTVSFRISILKNSETGTVIYSETHSLSTNEFGLANFKIGKGTKLSGEFSPANWGEVIFTKVEFDPAGGSSFTTLATTKLSSVPFAFVAQTVVNDKVNDADADSTNEIQTLSLNNNLLKLSNGGGSVTLPTSGSGSGDNWGVQTVETDATLTGDGLSTNPLSVVADGDGDDTNELQTLTKMGNSIELSDGGGSVTIDVEDADADPANEIQTLSLNNNLLELSNGGGQVTLPTTGTSGGDNWGVQTVETDATLTGDGTSTNPLSVVADGDGDDTNELQTITKTGNSIELSNGGGLVTDEVNDADADSTNEIQTLSLNNNLLKLSNGGGSVTLPTSGSGSGDNWGVQTVETDATLTGDGLSTNPLSVVGDLTDDQTLSLSGNNLSISDGNTVTLPASGNSLWSENNNGIYYRSNHVGIGTEPLNEASLAIEAPAGIIPLNVISNGDDAAIYANNLSTGPAAWFDGKIKITDGTEGFSKILTSDDDGLASWSNRVWWEGPDGVAERPGQVFIGDGSFTTTTILSSHTNKNLSAIMAKNNGSSPTISVSNDGNGLVADFAGRIRIYDDTRGEGKVLTSDAYGVGSWQTPANSPWTKTDDKISYNGAVGIGVVPDYNSPSLDVRTTADLAAIYTTNNSESNPPFQAYNQNANGAAAYFRNKIIIKDGTEGDGKVLTSDAKGNTSWQNPAGSLWTQTGNILSYPTGTVQIGTITTTDEGVQLDVRTTKDIAFYAENNNNVNSTMQVRNLGSGISAWFHNRIKISDGTQGDGKVLTSDASGEASWQTPATGSSSLWTESGSNVYRSSGNVGIGKIPSYLNKLDISGGNLHIDEDHRLTIGTRLSLYESVLNTFLSTKSGGYLFFCTSQGADDEVRLAIEPNGDVEITENLTVDKKIKITDGTQGVDKVLTSDANGLASWQTPATGSSSLWTESGSNVYRSSGKVGIGTDSPEEMLDLRNSTNSAAMMLTSANNSSYIVLDKGQSNDYANINLKTNGVSKFRAGLLGNDNYSIFVASTTKGLEITSAGDVNLSDDLAVSGNVGIGTTSPGAPLEIKSNANPALIIGSSTAGSPTRPGIQFKNNTSQWIAGDDGSDEIFGFYSQWNSARTHDAKLRVYGNASSSWGKYIQLTHNGTDGFISTDVGDIDITPAGNVGIKTAAPTEVLDVNGNARVRNIPSGSGTYAIVVDNNGKFFKTSSDRRLKENINTLDNSLDKILKLRGVSFTWKANPEYGTRIGFIAQEFEKVIPELAFTNPVDGYKGINYAEVSAVLVEAVKAQQKQIEALKAENNTLKADNKQIKTDNKQIVTRLDKLENLLTGYAKK